MKLLIVNLFGLISSKMIHLLLLLMDVNLLLNNMSIYIYNYLTIYLACILLLDITGIDYW